MGGDVGRLGELWGDMGEICRAMVDSGAMRDMGRRVEMCGDMGRCGEMWGDCAPELS